MQKVIIAGGVGFIGYHLSKKFLDRGDTVIAIDNLLTGSKDNVELLSHNSNFSFIEHDVIQPLDQFSEQLNDATTLYHLASPASPNKKSPRSYINYPIETMLVNSQGTHQLLEYAKKNSLKLIYASSSEIYGDPSVSPQSETYFGSVNSIGIRSVYDEGKRFGEALCMAYFRTYTTNVRIVRIFNTYGEHMQRDDGRVISNFIIQALSSSPITIYGDGSQTRSFCYIEDLIEGLVSASTTEGIKGEVINLGNPDEHTIKDMAELIKRLTGSASEIVYEPLPEDDPTKRKPDITKAKKLLDFEPKVTLEEGLIKTIEYFKRV